jgi:formate dehydrogenase subunit gamma
LERAPEWNREVVEAIARELKDEPGALMPILRRIQDELGWVPPASVPMIAEILNLSRAEVHGVLSFYHDFRDHPPGRIVVSICRAESCQAMGGVALADHVQRRLGIAFGQTSPDGAFTLEPVYCLGNCACSPAAMIGAKPAGRLTPARFDELIAHLERSRR